MNTDNITPTDIERLLVPLFNCASYCEKFPDTTIQGVTIPQPGDRGPLVFRAGVMVYACYRNTSTPGERAYVRVGEDPGLYFDVCNVQSGCGPAKGGVQIPALLPRVAADMAVLSERLQADSKQREETRSAELQRLIAIALGGLK